MHPASAAVAATLCSGILSALHGCGTCRRCSWPREGTAPGGFEMASLWRVALAEQRFPLAQGAAGLPLHGVTQGPVLHMHRAPLDLWGAGTTPPLMAARAEE